MQRLLSILLLIVLSAPLISPLLALTRDASAGLPACCRRNGSHHCMMTQTDQAALSVAGDRFSAPVERCPFYPRAMTTSHAGVMSPAAYSSILASPASHPSGVAQTESKRRISRDRSRRKRGPPAVATA